MAVANSSNISTIQILRSYANSTPSTLLDGQLAYSFVSNTLFIGSNTGVISIGDPSTAVIARSAQANTIITQGVDATQNTNIQLAYNQANTGTILAQAAFNSANNVAPQVQPAFNVANSASANTIITQGVDVTQNTRLTIIENVNLTQNTSLLATDGKMQSAYSQANAATTLAQAAFNLANTESSQVFTQSIANTANSASANTIIIQGVDISQNARMTIIEGVDVTQNTNITVATSLAQAAYNQANSAGSNQTVVAAFNQANSAYNVATSASSNTIYLQNALNTVNANTVATDGKMQSAYNQANVTAGGLITANANIAILFGTDASQNVRLDYSNAAITIIQGVDTSQNARMTIIEGVDVGQNNRMSIIEGTDVSQNARMTIIEGVNYTQNTIISNKLSLTGSLNQTVSGNVTISQDLIVAGNLVLTGNISSQNVQQLAVADPLILLGLGNYLSDTKDIGFAGHYNDGTNAHAGLIRDSDTKEWYLFKGYTPELDANNNVDITDASFSKANFNANYVKGNLIATTAVVNGLELYNYSTAAYAQANVTAGGLITANANTVYLSGALATANANIVSLQTQANTLLPNTGSLITVNGASQVYITNTTSSTSNTTGALVVSGGLGVSGDVYATNGTFTNRLTIGSGSTNYLNISGNTTGNVPIISSQGSDINIGINIKSKGNGSISFSTSNNTPFQILDSTVPGVNGYWAATYSGSFSQPVLRSYGTGTAFISNQQPSSIQFATNSTTPQFDISHTASAVNYLSATGNTTGNTPTLSAIGSDATIGITLSPKGNNSVNISSSSTYSILNLNTNNPTYSARLVASVDTTSPVTLYAGNADLLLRGGSSANTIISSPNAGIISAYRGATQFYVTPPLGLGYGVNWLQASGSSTGNTTILSVGGSDANVSMLIQPKGTGAFNIQTANGINLGSGNTTITAINISAVGTGYTSSPTVTISPPTSPNGTIATATIPIMVGGAVIINAGSGYANTDVLYANGTTSGTTSNGTFTQIASFVPTVNATGAIVSLTFSGIARGDYSIAPANPISLYGGTGTSGQVNLNWTLNNNASPPVTITNAGLGYVEQPTVTISGGGGSGGAAYAIVGGSTTFKSLGSQLLFNTSAGVGFGISQPNGLVSNYVLATGQATGGVPGFYSQGSDASVGLTFSSKNTGSIDFYTNTYAQAQFQITHTASSVNRLQVTGAVTGSPPVMAATGSDANIGLNFSAKGSSNIGFYSNSGTAGLQFVVLGTTATTVNRFTVIGSTTGNSPLLSVSGSDANVAINLLPQGNAAVMITGNTSGYIPQANSIYVGNRVGYANSNNISIMYQFYNSATQSYDLVFG